MAVNADVRGVPLHGHIALLLDYWNGVLSLAPWLTDDTLYWSSLERMGEALTETEVFVMQ